MEIMTVKEPVARLSEKELERNLRAVDHAIAQQRLEGLTVSESTVADMRRAAHGAIPADEVIANIYARFGHVTLFER
jgi:antitoxin VbhA-like protein